jgi:hypothetical protein
VRYELWVNLFLGMGIYIGYRQLAFNKLGFDKKTDFLLIPIIAVFVFSFRQYDNWVWGWQIQVFLCSLCSILSLALLSLYPPGIHTTACAALAAIVATFSFANGIILWPVGLMLLYLRGRRISCMTLWLVLAAICITTQILQSKNHMPSSVVSLPAYVKFICIYMGSSLGVEDNDFSFAYGVFGILSGMAICGLLFFSPYRKDSAFLFFSAVMLFIIFAAALTGISRAQLRIHDAGTSRYASFSIHFWIALAGLMMFYMKKVQNNELIKQVCLASLVLVVCASVHTSALSIKYFYRAEERSKIILFIKERRISPGTVNLRNVSWSDAYLFQQAAILIKYHLSFYAED